MLVHANMATVKLHYLFYVHVHIAIIYMHTCKFIAAVYILPAECILTHICFIKSVSQVFYFPTWR